MKTWTSARLFAAAMLLTAFALGVALAQPRAITLGAGERIQLDGRLADAAWQVVPLHDAFVQYLPLDCQHQRH
jgi:hypothetical protein